MLEIWNVVDTIYPLGVFICVDLHGYHVFNSQCIIISKVYLGYERVLNYGEQLPRTIHIVGGTCN